MKLIPIKNYLSACLPAGVSLSFRMSPESKCQNDLVSCGLFVVLVAENFISGESFTKRVFLKIKPSARRDSWLMNQRKRYLSLLKENIASFIV